MPETPQHRRRRIRRTVGAASLATFAIAWGAIAGTGAMGHGGGGTAAATNMSQRASAEQQQQLPEMTTRQS